MKSPFTAGFPGQRIGAVLVIAVSLFTILLFNTYLSKMRIKGEPLPEYAPWTGISTLDRKLSLLRDFASQGPVDALVIGPSISDHGISAAVLSRDLSAAYGKPFRVFNFSTGGAELSMFPSLYRLARAVSNPKQIWIAFPVEQRIGDDRTSGTPDYALANSPAGTALRHSWLLPLSIRLFHIPLVRYAMALRDLVIYGKFVNRPASQAFVYSNNAFGDTRGFLYYWGAVPFKTRAEERRGLVLELASNYGAAPDERARTDIYFSRGALAAIAELRALAAHEHFSITILAHDSSAGFASKDPEYRAASELFYKSLSERFGEPVINVLSSFHLADYKFADASHLNSNGADEISALMAAKMANRPMPPSSDFAAAREPSGIRSAPFTAVVLRRASDPGAELQLRYVQGLGVAPLRPNLRLQLVVLLPDNSTAIVPVRAGSRGLVVADPSSLPAPTGNQAIFLQMTAAGGKWGEGISWPLSSYLWSGTRTPSQGLIQETVPEVSTEAASYTPFDRIPASWTGIDSPAKKDWVGIFPVGLSNETPRSVKETGGTAAGRIEFPADVAAKPGQYELRLYENGSWNLLAFSKPFLISAHAVTIESTSKTVSAGARVHAVWSKLSPPSKDDWVGIFPRGGPDQSRLEFKFTGGKPEGALDLVVLSKATLGQYELRVYSAGGWNRLATSAPFEVVASAVRLTVDESKVAPGYPIHVRWAGLDSPEKDDWIGLFPKGGKDGSRSLFRATGGSASGDWSFTIPPATVAGQYEFRLYAHNSWRLVATSSPFQIISRADQK